MAKSETNESPSEVGPSIVLGLVGAIVVLVVLGTAIWGVGKIISKVRESNDEETEVAEQVTEESTSSETTVAEEGDLNGEGAVTENTETSEEEIQAEKVEESENTTSEESTVAEAEENQQELVQEQTKTEETSTETEVSESTTTPSKSALEWIANDYKSGDISGSNYTVVWGDTLWEIAEAKYGSGFEWGKIRDANLDIIGFLPDGSRALIIPGQVLALP